MGVDEPVRKLKLQINDLQEQRHRLEMKRLDTTDELEKPALDEQISELDTQIAMLNVELNLALKVQDRESNLETTEE